MKRPPSPDLQRAIEFLSDRGLAKGVSLPARPDYDSLARHASELGHELSPGAVQEAFRLIMHARLVASRKPSRADGGDR